jgi:hypothetical protein
MINGRGKPSPRNPPAANATMSGASSPGTRRHRRQCAVHQERGGTGVNMPFTSNTAAPASTCRSPATRRHRHQHAVHHERGGTRVNMPYTRNAAAPGSTCRTPRTRRHQRQHAVHPALSAHHDPRRTIRTATTHTNEPSAKDSRRQTRATVHTASNSMHRQSVHTYSPTTHTRSPTTSPTTPFARPPTHAPTNRARRTGPPRSPTNRLAPPPTACVAGVLACVDQERDSAWPPAPEIQPSGMGRQDRLLWTVACGRFGDCRWAPVAWHRGPEARSARCGLFPGARGFRLAG